ncbi:tRNA pseudouridine(55) synthase TruB [Bacteroidota bacterium]
MRLSNPQDFLDGQVVLIDKEIDWTSFDVVNKLRRSLRTELNIPKIKVGHAGTLDPLASGLVIICTGKATKRIESFQDLEKEYVAEVTLGATTPSFDLETEIDEQYPTDHINLEIISETLKKFTGTITQIPPRFSAKQIDGKRAYDLARQGEKIKMRPNLVEIYEIEILEFVLPKLTLRVRCGKGTYIRSLAHDLGVQLRSGAHLSGLRRTKIGDYHVNDAQKISDFVKKLRPL